MISFLIILTSITPFTAAIFIKENKFKILFLLIYGNFWIREFVGNFLPIYYMSNDDYLDFIRLILNCTFYLLLTAFIYYFLMIEKRIKHNLLPQEKAISYNIEFLLSLSIAVIMMFLIIYVTATTLWITNPREAHMNFRSSIGPIYATFLMCSTMMLFYIARLTLKFRVLGYLCLIFLSYVSGSKGFALNVCLSIFAVELTFNKNIFKNIIQNLSVFVVIVSITTFIILLQFFKGIYNETIAERLSEYFFQWYDLQNRLFLHYLSGKFELRFGELYVSSFWDLVPRFFYEDKPTHHGSVKLIEIFFPESYRNLGNFSFGFLSYEFADWGALAPIMAFIYKREIWFPILLLIFFKNYIYQKSYAGFLIFCFVIVQGFTPYFNFVYIIIITFFYWHVIKIISYILRRAKKTKNYLKKD